MRSMPSLKSRLPWLSAIPAAALLATALVGTAVADDRDLLRGGSAKPNVFIIFDTSGSMNWQPSGDAYSPANGDDPASKMYQAKSGIFRVLERPELDGIRWGFASYDQDSSTAYRKHYLYTNRTAPSAAWAAALPHPQVGRTQVFGDVCGDDSDGDDTCDFDADNILSSCTANTAFDENDPNNSMTDVFRLTDAEEARALFNWPVTGDTGSTLSTQWISHGGTRWELKYQLAAGSTLGQNTITVNVSLREWRRTSTPSCSSTSAGPTPPAGTALRNFGTVAFTYERTITTDSQGRTLLGPSSMLAYQNNNSNPNDPWDFHDTGSSNTCAGLDLNSDTGNDDNSATYNLKTTTIADPLTRGALFSRGDFVPLDWKDDVETLVAGVSTGWMYAPVPTSHRLSNRNFIKRKLAPNFAPGMTGDPDFRTATYYQDHPVDLTPNDNTEGIKPLAAYASVPPLYPDGSTPLGNSLKDFMTWFDGWKSIASADPPLGDPKFDCRSTNIIFVTDGDETCYDDRPINPADAQDSGGDWNPCYVANQLWAEGNRRVRTYVIGFGLPSGTGNFLQCMADKGATVTKDYNNNGTIEPNEQFPGVLLPQDEDELVDAITRSLESIRAGVATFASAAVPSVQADATDKVILTEFTPIKDESVWPSKIYSFVKPVPIDPISKKPDLNAACTSETDTACFAWEAQEAIVEEQVRPNEVTGDMIGDTASQRRLYHPEALRVAVPQLRRFFEATGAGDLPPRKRDLWTGMRIAFDPLVPATEVAAEARANATLNRMVDLRTTPDGTQDYVMGDNFHSDPLSIGSPANTVYFQQDAGLDLAVLCTDDQNDEDRRYQRFAFKQERRRRMLALGTNEGALHFLDTGIFREGATLSDPGKFTNGTGQELFAYVPRIVMHQIEAIFDPDADEPSYTVDGKTVATDVLIDPIHSGFGSGSPPAACDRRWRTVVVGGLREGGGSASLAERPRTTPTDVSYRTGSYYALDVTEPDPVTDLRASSTDPNHIPFFVPTIASANETVPTCLGDSTGAGLPTGCGPIPFASTLWEFNDAIDGIRHDEDDNGHIDIAQTWSTPNVGRIRVCVSNCANVALTDDVIETRFVAIFGGGVDPDNRNIRGNWLYIVDIETGDAIYKRRLRGAAPSEPAAIDTDFDGYLDRIYIGDLFGLMYRVDLSQPVSGGGVKHLPLASVTISEIDRNNLAHSRTIQRSIDSTFGPRVFFNATGNNTTDSILSATTSLTARPIFYPPSVIFVPELEKYALAFGTGNRMDLIAVDQPPGRFFVVTDDFAWSELPDATVDTGQPLNRASLFNVDFAIAPTPTANYLTNRAPHTRGWHTEVEANERLVVEPLTISGVVLFSMFTPRQEVDPNDPICEQTGRSRLFGVFASNAAGVLSSALAEPVAGEPAPPYEAALPFITIQDLTTSFFVEQMQTGNPPEGGETHGEITEAERDTMENVKRQMPQTCTFPPGYGSRINTRTSRGSYRGVVTIPLCVIESNFRED